MSVNVNNVLFDTHEKDIDVKYGMFNLVNERDGARTSLRYILSDISDIKERYIRLGFHLWEFDKCKYYEDFGYATFKEFCEVNIPLDKSSIYRCMKVWHEFAYVDDNNSRKMWLDDRYLEYSYSQLQEMLSLDDKKRRYVTPGMTVKDIRELKKKVTVDADVIKRFVEDYKKLTADFTRESVLAAMEKDGETHHGHCSGGYNYDMKPGYVHFGSCRSGVYYSFNAVLNAYELNGGKFESEVATSQPDNDSLPASGNIDIIELLDDAWKELAHTYDDTPDESIRVAMNLLVKIINSVRKQLRCKGGL